MTEVTRDFPESYSELQGITKQRFMAQASLQTKFIPNPKKKKKGSQRTWAIQNPDIRQPKFPPPKELQSVLQTRQALTRDSKCVNLSTFFVKE